MKTDTLKKSLLDYAIKGKLTARFRRENNGLNAFNEINTYNEAIKEKRKDLEKKLKICEKELKLEKDKDKKALFKSQIQSLKKELTKCKEITPLNFSEAPFEIPNSWAWVKLGDICEIFTGDSINATEKEKNFTHQTSGLNYIATKDLANDTSITYENGIKIPDEFLPSFKIAKANSTLLCIEGGSAGRKVGFLKENVCFGNKLCCFENIFAFSKFVFYFLQSGEFSKEFNSNINGIIGGVKKESIRHFLIPLPPLKEQQEIVKKLDLLVTLANDFAITKENLKRIEKRIEKSLLKLALEGSLSKLYRRSSPTLSAFDEINTYNEAIKEKRKDLEKELKKCEKELKLEKDKDKKALFKSQIQMLKKELTKCKEITPLFCQESRFFANAQNAVSLENDKKACHTASTCHTDLEQSEREVSNNTESTTSIIAKRKGVYPLPAPLNPEKNKVAAVSKEASLSFRQSRGEPRLSASSTQAEAGHYCPPFSAFAHHEAGESEAPFEIPNSWAWVKLGDICEINPKNDISDNVEISFIPMALIADSCQNAFTYELKLWKEVKGGFTHLRDNSVAFAKISPCFENGKSFVVKNLKNGYGAGTTELIVLLPYNPLLKEYVFYCVNSAFFVNQALKTFKGTAGQQRLSMDFVENFTIPLPPLREQEYITQILDTLFTLKKGLRIE